MDEAIKDLKQLRDITSGYEKALNEAINAIETAKDTRTNTLNEVIKNISCCYSKTECVGIIKRMLEE